MLKLWKSSLPARAGLAVILIATLALCSAVSAGVIAWISEDDAAAINTAGSLRMATYRLNWQLEAGASAERIQGLADDLERRLTSEPLRHIAGTPDDALGHTYQSIQTQWHTRMRPLLSAGDAVAFQREAEAFVGQLEAFVSQLQKQSERRQGWQQAIQGGALLLTVVILLVGMYELYTNVLYPLQDLVRATERFRAGDLDARVAYQSQDELGRMAQSFNAMADVIEQSHHTLEARVAQKTESLAQSNAALELLYLSSAAFASQPASAGQLDELIANFQQRLPGLRLTLCLSGHGSAPPEHLIALHGSESRKICSRTDCDACTHRHPADLQAYRITSQGATLGELRARFLDGHPVLRWEARLIEALASLIGTALSLERQREQSDRLLLLDERTTIARELHDSLAQALSYMKLQVSRLQTLIRRGEPADALLQVSDELRDGLNNAYRQLRELLTTFRLQIQDGGLDEALDDTVREFAERGALRVLLDAEPLPFALSATEQIHLLQIAREALSNCARHARAEQACVYLRQVGEEVELSIEDDGCGIDPGFDDRQHHGLNIMQERARSLGGRLAIGPRCPRGTRVQLRFCPDFLRHLPDEVPA